MRKELRPWPKTAVRSIGKAKKVRRANRIIQNRTMILMAVLGVLVFLILVIKLFSLQILRHDELEAKALDQQTRSTEVAATRGTIYDRNGNIMAISATAETVFLPAGNGPRSQ